MLFYFQVEENTVYNMENPKPADPEQQGVIHDKTVDKPEGNLRESQVAGIGVGVF